jgi:hypothetical protein
MAHQKALKQLARQAVRATFIGTRVGLRLLGRTIGLLAASAQTSPADDELSSSIRGGVLNHRTGKFDDGTDPAGIYKLD